MRPSPEADPPPPPAARPKRTAVVRLDGARAGTIEEFPDEYVFSYDRGWLERREAVPVSLTLPLREEPYRSRSLHAFFENLLPEGWLLEIATKALKVSKDDAFGILLATCADCIGAVEILPAEPEAAEIELS